MKQNLFKKKYFPQKGQATLEAIILLTVATTFLGSIVLLYHLSETKYMGMLQARNQLVQGQKEKGGYRDIQIKSSITKKAVSDTWGGMKGVVKSEYQGVY